MSGKYVTIKDHLSSAHRFYGEWSPDFFKKLAKPLGESVTKYVAVLIESQTYPEAAYKQCLGIINLKSSYEKKRINTACKHALQMSRYGYHIIQRILKNNMDLAEPPFPESDKKHIAPHSNIRGEQAYS